MTPPSHALAELHELAGQLARHETAGTPLMPRDCGAVARAMRWQLDLLGISTRRLERTVEELVREAIESEALPGNVVRLPARAVVGRGPGGNG